MHGCINRISGEKLNNKIKVKVTKGQKERYVIDGFLLDEITKAVSYYSYIIEIQNIIYIYSIYKFIQKILFL